MISQEEARARVARGAAYLDVVRPGWFNRIDVGTLTLHDPCGCIVGQLAHQRQPDECRDDYDRYREEWLDLFGPYGGEAEGVVISFHELGPTLREIYQPLKDAWIEAIADRRLSTASNGTPADDAVPASSCSTPRAEESLSSSS